MDYEKLIGAKKALAPDADEAARQAAMETGVRLAVESQDDPSPRIHDMMKKAFVSCSEAEKTLTLSYEVAEWELNPLDTMHGGLIAAAIDTTCGMLVRYLSGEARTPTVTLTVNYLKPVFLGDRMLVTAEASHVGKRVVNLTARAETERREGICATATAVFMILK